MFDFSYAALDILYAYPEDSGVYTVSSALSHSFRYNVLLADLHNYFLPSFIHYPLVAFDIRMLYRQNISMLLYLSQ